jgi:hypothetical protein
VQGILTATWLARRAGWLACAFLLVFQKTVTQKEKLIHIDGILAL